MKDLYDILFLASQSSFELSSLHKAILSTFRHRMTPVENRKAIFEEGFKSSKEKQNPMDSVFEAEPSGVLCLILRGSRAFADFH